MAQDLLQAQVITPQDYIQIVSTGKIETVIEDEESEDLLIRGENEDIREGKEVIVTAVDSHLKHIKGHKNLFNDPDARRDPQLMQAALGHIQEHINALRTVDPALLIVLGQAPIGLGVPPQGENAPQPPGNQPQGGPQGPQDVNAVPPPNTPPDIAANMPNLPNLPAGAPPEMNNSTPPQGANNV